MIARVRVARILSVSLLGTALVAGIACKSRPTGTPLPITSPMTLGGRTISVESLRHGGEVYTHYCRPCHGTDGSGNGASAPALRPPPRVLRRGVY